MALVLVAMPAVSRAETADISTLMAQLQTLMKQVETLQAQLATLKGEIREELKEGLKEGVTDEDVKKVQELLASDSTIYPRGLVSGYYGPLTKEAVMAFQKRHNLPQTGEVDAATKKLMLEYFKEKKNGKIPPGLFKNAAEKNSAEKPVIKLNKRGDVSLKCELDDDRKMVCKMDDDSTDDEDEDEDDEDKDDDEDDDEDDSNDDDDDEDDDEDEDQDN